MLKYLMLAGQKGEDIPFEQFNKLVASDGAAGDYFGYSVSISSDGGSIVIGVYLDDDKGSNSGSAYVFTKQENGQYTQTQKLLASDGAADDKFGYSVSISGDGGAIVIGAYQDDDKGSNSGSAYVFTRQENGLYTQSQKLVASDGAANVNFGYSVSISGDGGSIVIGAYRDSDKGSSSGSAYVFTKQENGQYTQSQKLLASDGAANSRFGGSVSISSDDGSIVIGAYWDKSNGVSSGSAYVFARQENGQYTETQKLVASDATVNDSFGHSVSISGDGGTIVIGAYWDDDKGNDSGSAYIFK